MKSPGVRVQMLCRRRCFFLLLRPEELMNPGSLFFLLPQDDFPGNVWFSSHAWLLNLLLYLLKLEESPRKVSAAVELRKGTFPLPAGCDRCGNATPFTACELGIHMKGQLPPRSAAGVSLL